MNSVSTISLSFAGLATAVVVFLLTGNGVAASASLVGVMAFGIFLENITKK